MIEGRWPLSSGIVGALACPQRIILVVEDKGWQIVGTHRQQGYTGRICQARMKE